MNKISEACNYFNCEAHNYIATEEFLETSARQVLYQHISHANNKNLVLDVCCGKGLMVKLMKEAGFQNIYGTDGSVNMMKFCPLSEENLFLHDFYNGDLEIKIKFNHITIHAGLPFINNAHKFLCNMRNLMNITSIVSFNFREKTEEDEIEKDEYGEFHKETFLCFGYKFYLYSKQEMEKITEQAGFKILESKNYQFGTNYPVDSIMITAKNA